MNGRPAAMVAVRPRAARLGITILLAAAAMVASPIADVGDVAARLAAHRNGRSFDLAAPRAESGARPAVAAPLRVIPNKGQWPDAVLYRADTATGALFVTADGITRVDVAGDGSLRVRRTAIHGDRFVPGAHLPGVAHYLRGADRTRWVRDVPAYDSVTIVGAGPGPTAAVRVAADTLNRLAAGPASAAAADVAASGDFAADVVPSNDAASDVGAALVDAAEVTTPTLAYSTYLGGRLNELARGIAVDAEGSAYVVGTTTSIDFPVAGAAAGPGSPTAEPLQPTLGNGGSLQDAFVTKLDPTGTRIVWSTYLGGIRQDEAFDVAVDTAGRAHVTGYTSSPDFPTARAVQPELHLAEGIWSGDAFVARLSADGGDLEVGTFFGGTGRDVGKGIALGADGSAYVTGWTGSNLPAVNAVYPLNRGVRDAFIAKYTPDGDRLAYTTHLGGADADEARDIAVDGAGNAYIAGSTISLNLRTAAPFQSTLRGERDVFVARLNAGGTAFDYATYLGGRGTDEAIGIAVDAAGGAVVLGRTTSPDFPRANALQPTRSGPADLFVTRLAADGGALVYSTFLGGNGDEGGCVPAENYRDLGTPTPDGRGIRYLEGSKFTDGPAGALALDPEGRAVVAGCTGSGNLILRRPIQTRRSGDYALLLAVLDADGQSLAFGSYLGGRGMDVARAVAVGPDGGVYVAGQTDSVDFPTAPAGRVLQAVRSGTDDAFALKIMGVAAMAPPTPQKPPTPTDVPTPAPSATATATVEGTPSPIVTPLETAAATPVPTSSTTAAAPWLRLYVPAADVP